MIKNSIFTLYNSNIFIKNLNLDLEEFKIAAFNLPSYLYQNITRIYIHDSSQMTSKNIDSVYSNGIIEINSVKCKDIKTTMKLLLHELYHANEDEIKIKFKDEYQDVIREYINKRNVVLTKIKNVKILEAPKEEYFGGYEYNSDFDDYLCYTITYPMLYTRIFDIFPSPYAMTSIDEYIAVCFEVFLFENKDFVINYCPKISKLIESVLNEKR